MDLAIITLFDVKVQIDECIIFFFSKVVYIHFKIKKFRKIFGSPEINMHDIAYSFVTSLWFMPAYYNSTEIIFFLAKK